MPTAYGPTITCHEWTSGIWTLSSPGTAAPGWGEDYAGSTWWTVPLAAFLAACRREGVAPTPEGIDADTPAAARVRREVKALGDGYGRAP